jgi:hypothetical protein
VCCSRLADVLLLEVHTASIIRVMSKPCLQIPVSPAFKLCFASSYLYISYVHFISLLFSVSRCSSVSVVSGYGLHDRAFEVRSLAEAKDFSSSLCVQTGSGAHPASCTIGTGRPFPGGKVQPERDTDHSPLSSAEIKSE